MSLAVLAVNPGSMSTRTALFRGEERLFSEEVVHAKEDLLAFGRVSDQLSMRLAAVRRAVAEKTPAGVVPAAVAGRGGLLRPVPGGVYRVGPAMLADLAAARFGEHPCNLGAPMALDLAADWGVPAFVADPPVTDEMEDLARITGLPGVSRRSVLHALSQRGAARKAAADLGVRYEDGRFLVAHMGGGISIGAHRLGRIVDVINALDGEGPFSPERAGRLPAVTLLTGVEEGRYTPAGLKRAILKEGGLWAHLGTGDLRLALARREAGEERAALVLEAMAYNIAKEIASLAPALAADGPIDAVVLTGGMARSGWLVCEVGRRVRFLAPVLAVTGDEEMRTLAMAAMRALSGEEPVREY